MAVHRSVILIPIRLWQAAPRRKSAKKIAIKSPVRVRALVVANNQLDPECIGIKNGPLGDRFLFVAFAQPTLREG